MAAPYKRRGNVRSWFPRCAPSSPPTVRPYAGWSPPPSVRTTRSTVPTSRRAGRASGTTGASVSWPRSAASGRPRRADQVGGRPSRPGRFWVLSPLSVVPGRQREGFGTALVAAAVETAEGSGTPALFLEGSPALLRRAGLRAGRPARLPARRVGADARGGVPGGGLRGARAVDDLRAGLPVGLVGARRGPAARPAPGRAGGAVRRPGLTRTPVRFTMNACSSPPRLAREVRPPDAPDWERTACNWLLEQRPPDFRAYPALRKHPVVLARFAVLYSWRTRRPASAG